MSQDRAAGTPSWYDVLQVSRAASAEEIRSAYLRLIRVEHPDVHGGDGHDRAALLNAAFEVLGHPEARARYDMTPTGETMPLPEPARYATPAHDQQFAQGSWDIPDWPR
ncbi:Chaperone protein DnaJ [Austwickia sp. TVS 96-490-7B]|uniref:J domain-containing protein n=1 Tax=Austwickia sp. TVS 96-490-7B TaxID=2830843 RepID=UPI001C5A3670|nr:J domain-containing protein [Austwickia sp. TVS 96-490-7B]MBW3086752.1 Chaperone protein DnaJ [Austwickia sp. TVS 96-490-7B]